MKTGDPEQPALLYTLKVNVPFGLTPLDRMAVSRAEVVDVPRVITEGETEVDKPVLVAVTTNGSHAPVATKLTLSPLYVVL